jgi:hypothetical protein
MLLNYECVRNIIYKLICFYILVEVTLRLTVGQSVSQYVLVSSLLWDFLPDITSCRNVAV